MLGEEPTFGNIVTPNCGVLEKLERGVDVVDSG